MTFLYFLVNLIISMIFDFPLVFKFEVIVKIVKVILVFVLAFLFNFFCQNLLKKFISEILEKTEIVEKKTKIKTILSFVLGTTKFLILLCATLIALSIVGINIGPILASLGILGLTLSLGAREIVADFLAGTFILLENEYNVGDYVQIGEKKGIVKEITLRKTVLEDETGFLHSIPNSQIKIISKKKQ